MLLQNQNTRLREMYFASKEYELVCHITLHFMATENAVTRKMFVCFATPQYNKQLLQHLSSQTHNTHTHTHLQTKSAVLYIILECV